MYLVALNRDIMKKTQKLKHLKLPLSFLATITLFACQNEEERKQTFFTPEPLKAGEPIIQSFSPENESSPQSGHVVIDEALRSNPLCLSCHQQQIESTTLPINQKGIHEIHFSLAKIETKCIFCHENAGNSGFPELLGNGDRRTEYNQKCIQCHYQERDGSKTFHW